MIFLAVTIAVAIAIAIDVTVADAVALTISVVVAVVVHDSSRLLVDFNVGCVRYFFVIYAFCIHSES